MNIWVYVPTFAKSGKTACVWGRGKPLKNRVEPSTFYHLYTEPYTAKTPYYIYIFYYMVYRVYRVYGYFQKSIYGIYFTFPIIRSGGWESDLLYGVIETRKNPDLPATAPPVWESPNLSTNTVG